MRVLVGGGTGFVGRTLTQLLRSRGHEVTHISREGGKDRISWGELSHSGLPLCDAVVNLAGENVLNPFRRWSDAFCREVINSRVETTRTLAKAIANAEEPPHAWVLVTGVGYYRPSPTAEYTEDSHGGDFDFFSRLVSAWEAAALIPGSPTRGVVVRSGVVLGKGGGAISQMLLPFRLGLGGPLGSGLQPFPWIHIQDLAGIVCHALETESVQGVLNGVSPSSPMTSNATFAQEFAAALGRPALLPVPAWAVRAVFGSERAVMLLEGQKVVPKHTLESGYQFIFPDLSAALRDVVA
ncbi:epimerase family protein SDR39U1 isoform X1 [Calypte anna]|uniref:epimerase family protein SDR39U1 isoform X1 n=1 Tax=Calypte anna TaxID=9244 RepID=UPI0004C0731A|nr:epimerase family protein SDR39U1 isoform X1 [Calypte anna]XP_030321939.1 epimerase family protein SDR39U1 isoform X1 [Calypte anna]